MPSVFLNLSTKDSSAWMLTRRWLTRKPTPDVMANVAKIDPAILAVSFEPSDPRKICRHGLPSMSLLNIGHRGSEHEKFALEH